MADSSFDIVSKIDKQEVANAVNQAAKEIGTRYDFRNVGASVELNGDNLMLKANTAERVLAVLDVLQSKLIRRGISLKALDVGEQGALRHRPQPLGHVAIGMAHPVLGAALGQRLHGGQHLAFRIGEIGDRDQQRQP